jgi:hypothetical protein
VKQVVQQRSAAVAIGAFLRRSTQALEEPSNVLGRAAQLDAGTGRVVERCPSSGFEEI